MKELLLRTVLFLCVFHMKPSAAVPEFLYEERLEFDSEGNLRMTTHDKAATTKITYQTIGWTMKQHAGALGEENKGAVLVLKENGAPKTDPENPAYQYCCFYTDKMEVFHAINKADEQWRQFLYENGGVVYFDAVMTVCENGAAKGRLTENGAEGEVYFTYEEIAGARDWADKEGLKSHFHKKLEFPALPDFMQSEPNESTRIDSYNCGSNGEPKLTKSIKILAEEKGNEYFDVSEGIPTGELLYTDGECSTYWYQAYYKKVEGTKYYKIEVHTNYTLRWSGTGGKRFEENVTDVSVYDIPRAYSYWKLEKLNLFYLKECSVINYAFEGNRISEELRAAPDIELEQTETEALHIKEPAYNRVITFEGGIIDGGNQKPSLPKKNDLAVVQKSIPKIKVKNDTLRINGVPILEGSWSDEKTKEPVLPNEDFKTKFEIRKQKIPHTKRNGKDYESFGILTYQKYGVFGEKQVGVEEINPVSIHTPVVCRGEVSDEKSLNQKLYPNKQRSSLILGRPFQIVIHTEGMHRDIKGYGKRDYKKYTELSQVKFPFEVYIGENYYEQGSWISLEEVTGIHLPTGVAEGNYKIECRTAAKNYRPEDDENKQQYANLDFADYIATDFIEVSVVGRLYGAKIIDIVDYPRWETVFRREDKITPTGFVYYSGTKNENGHLVQNKERAAIPLIRGSHLYQEQYGILKKGYKIKFLVQTIGDMYSKSDYLHIIPSFYYVDKNGKNRKPVDIYYESDTEDGKKFVKFGSDFEKSDKKQIHMTDAYSLAPIEELIRSSKLMGMEFSQIYEKPAIAYTFSEIQLSFRVRNFIGSEERNVKNTKKALMSMQEWYGEYYLPASFCAVEKDTDLEAYIKEKYAVSEKDSIFLKNGYIIVNFQIRTLKNKKEELCYQNKRNAYAGYCNMWKTEGFQKKRVDSEGIAFAFWEGDFILYDLDSSMRDDFQIMGTH